MDRPIVVHRSAFQRHEAPGNGLPLLEIVGGENYCLALPFEAPHQVLQESVEAASSPVKGSIKQQKLRVMQKRSRQ